MNGGEEAVTEINSMPDSRVQSRSCFSSIHFSNVLCTSKVNGHFKLAHNHNLSILFQLFQMFQFCFKCFNCFNCSNFVSNVSIVSILFQLFQATATLSRKNAQSRGCV